MTNSADNYLTPGEVAEILKVSPITVRQWAQKGWLPAQITAGGHRRFEEAAVKRFAQERGISYQPQTDGKLKVLIVDDDMQLVGMLKEVLAELNGHVEVELAFDGYDAGLQVVQFKPDVVLLDLMMPGMNGFSVCKRIKENEETRHIRVIAMTGFFNEMNMQQIMQAGAETCLPKPFAHSDLLNLLDMSPPEDNQSNKNAKKDP